MNITVERIGRSGLQSFAQGGCADLAWFPSDMVIAEPTGQPLCGKPFDSVVQAEVREAGDKKHARFLAESDVLVQVSPFIGLNGQQYFIVQRLPPVNTVWWPRFPPEALSISGAVTFLLAYFLTRPVRALSKAFRRFADGDMEARLPISRSLWKDFGGADIHSLMVDFNHMAARIRELVDAQRLLVRDVSHELRSPLSRLQVALGIAREEWPESIEMLDQASTEADRLNVLIGELLTLSLMESMRQAPSTEVFTLGEIFDLLLPNMKFEAASHGAHIAYGASCEEFFLRGHPEMLRRAFENVVRNAIRYTPEGGGLSVTASIHEARLEDEGPKTHSRRVCEVLVEDRGPGVPPECLKEIFRPFYRVDMAREGTTGGFGVGLAIAERSITLHQGKISVENRVGGGLTVRISIPESYD